MSAEVYVSIVRNLSEIINSGRLGSLDKIVSESIIDHASLPSQAPGLDGFKQRIITFRYIYAEPNMAIDDIITEEDKVRWKWKAVHPGSDEVIISGTDIERIADGKIVEHWSELDRSGPVHRLSAIPDMSHITA